MVHHAIFLFNFHLPFAAFIKQTKYKREKWKIKRRRNLGEIIINISRKCNKFEAHAQLATGCCCRVINKNNREAHHHPTPPTATHCTTCTTAPRPLCHLRWANVVFFCCWRHALRCDAIFGICKIHSPLLWFTLASLYIIGWIAGSGLHTIHWKRSIS